MNFLEERIVKDGIVKSGNVLNRLSGLADEMSSHFRRMKHERTEKG